MNLKQNAVVLLTISAVSMSAFAQDKKTERGMDNPRLAKKAAKNKKNRPKLVTKLLKKLDKKAAAKAEDVNVVSATQKAEITPRMEAQISKEPAKPNKLIPITVSVWSNFSGPTFTDPGKMAATDDSRDTVTGLTLRSQPSFRYQLPMGLAVTPVLDFDYQFTEPNEGGTGRRQFRWRDCFVKFSKSDLLHGSIAGNDISLNTDLRYLVPSSKRSRDTNSYGSTRLSLNPSIQFGNSRFSLAMTNYIRYYLQSQDKDQNGNSLNALQLYTGPQLNYSINDKITAWVLYEAINTWNKDGKRTDELSHDASLTDVEPGVDFQITDRISISPYLNWYPNQRLSTTTMNLQAVINLY